MVDSNIFYSFSPHLNIQKFNLQRDKIYLLKKFSLRSSSPCNTLYTLHANYLIGSFTLRARFHEDFV